MAKSEPDWDKRITQTPEDAADEAERRERVEREPTSWEEADYDCGR